MKVSGGITEAGTVVGNLYDKYGTRNPIARALMRGFAQSLDELVAAAAPRGIHEVGCGEGYWVIRWLEAGIDARGSDFSGKVIEMARDNALKRGLDSSRFTPCSIYDLDPDRDRADLVICCEVLEHLERPHEALRVLQRITASHLILSVPREPLWRVLNMARGKYLGQLGNTPGHLRNWSRRGFVAMVSGYFEVLAIRTPVPWTMLLCRPISGRGEDMGAVAERA